MKYTPKAKNEEVVEIVFPENKNAIEELHLVLSDEGILFATLDEKTVTETLRMKYSDLIEIIENKNILEKVKSEIENNRQESMRRHPASRLQSIDGGLKP